MTLMITTGLNDNKPWPYTVKNEVCATCAFAQAAYDEQTGEVEIFCKSRREEVPENFVCTEFYPRKGVIET